jgi:hypothetical protein
MVTEQEIKEITDYLNYQFSMGKPRVAKLVYEIKRLQNEVKDRDKKIAASSGLYGENKEA